MSSGGSPGLPPGWAPTLLEPVAVPAAFKPHSPVPAPEPNLQDHIEDTRWLLESAQAEADGLCEEIRRLARVSVTAADAGGGGRTSPEDEQGQFNQAHHIYRVVEEELVRLRQQHEEYLEQREQEQQAAILEQRDALRAAQQRLRTAQELGEAEGKARAEAERAKLSAEESLGRLGLEVVRLREREAVLLEELSARRSDEGQRIKQNEEIKSLRTSLAAERRRREDAEAISRERFEEIRQAARTRKEAEELAEESRQHSQERWRKQRSLERENRQLRERLQTLQEASIELNSVRMEIEEAHEDSKVMAIAGTFLGRRAVIYFLKSLADDHFELQEQLLESLAARLGGSFPVAVGLMRNGDVLLGPALDLAQQRMSAVQVLVANALLRGEAFEALGCREKPRGGSVDLLRQLENFQEVKWFGGPDEPGSFEGLFAQRCAADTRLVDVIGAGHG
ncbi:unnamed protein product [Symbiodinium natans]|uniref:Uncharacterized protein n=1 Tax=Symbiodinium natans TaxID=878477 RepID=A0A812Q8F4_9DINO|nr:unnamed protein product [Symbiodinium natans]